MVLQHLRREKIIKTAACLVEIFPASWGLLKTSEAAASKAGWTSEGIIYQTCRRVAGLLEALMEFCLCSSVANASESLRETLNLRKWINHAICSCLRLLVTRLSRSIGVRHFWTVDENQLECCLWSYFSKLIQWDSLNSCLI